MDNKKIPMEEYTRFERARLVGSRALQISMGAPFKVKLNEKDLKRIKYNPVEIAKMELEKGVIPIDIRRPVVKSGSEEEVVKTE
jgi:DNA-directed RNA polymerase subunit K/omega